MNFLVQPTLNFPYFFPNDLDADFDGFLVVFSDFFKKVNKRDVMSDRKPGSIKIAEGWNDADPKNET